MAKQLIPDAKSYCLWQYSAAIPSGELYAYTMCDMDYREKLEDAKKRAVCPVCERPIKWGPTPSDRGDK